MAVLDRMLGLPGFNAFPLNEFDALISGYFLDSVRYPRARLEARLTEVDGPFECSAQELTRLTNWIDTSPFWSVSGNPTQQMVEMLARLRAMRAVLQDAKGRESEKAWARAQLDFTE